MSGRDGVRFSQFDVYGFMMEGQACSWVFDWVGLVIYVILGWKYWAVGCRWQVDDGV